MSWSSVTKQVLDLIQKIPWGSTSSASILKVVLCFPGFHRSDPPMYKDLFTLLWQHKRILKVSFDDPLGRQSSNKTTLNKWMKNQYSVFTYTFYLQSFKLNSALFLFIWTFQILFIFFHYWEAVDYKMPIPSPKPAWLEHTKIYLTLSTYVSSPTDLDILMSNMLCWTVATRKGYHVSLPQKKVPCSSAQTCTGMNSGLLPCTVLPCSTANIYLVQ